MKSSRAGRKQKLTVFLIKDSYKEIDDFLSFNGFQVVPLQNGEKEIGTLIYKSGFQSTPSWVSIFEGLNGFDSRSIVNQSSKALYVLKHDGRWFCFTFGYARHLIDELAYERNFGLIVSLNLGDPAAIKSIDKTNISHISLHSREQAAREIELANFEFDNDIDLLKSITAKSPLVKGEEQETLSGRDSVTVYTTVTVEAFSDIAKRLYDAFNSKKYKKHYPWLGKIKEERDTQVIDDLDRALVSKILKKDFHKIWLAIPELLEWEQVRGFAYKYRSEGLTKAGPVLYQDLDIDEWSKVARIDDELTAKQLKSKKIFLYWEDGRDPSSWSAYRCLNAEIDLKHKKYILNDGDWYNIESVYVKEVTDFFGLVPDSSIKLPPFSANNEPDYLKSVSEPPGVYALMDRKEVMIGGGRSRVEFCDL
ncbi:MAG: TIGR04141 family sporadically distributed protein, partial [Nitrososphaera sp.]|nr:TIGR04141 family sporadically distributed protein [Nitrososphaera sp.]